MTGGVAVCASETPGSLGWEGGHDLARCATLNVENRLCVNVENTSIVGSQIRVLELK